MHTSKDRTSRIYYILISWLQKGNPESARLHRLFLSTFGQAGGRHLPQAKLYLVTRPRPEAKSQISALSLGSGFGQFRTVFYSVRK